ncbi:MAG: radical SAM protein [Candidatus Omnitrophica bacterium]|nr:radical SAM protein [Candidatus Omnitrophota bacterium]
MPEATLLERLYDKATNYLVPLYTTFELTFRCNLTCSHCYVVEQETQEINTRTACDILDQLKEAGCIYLVFTGGEILLRKDFFEIAEYAKSIGFALILFTNGTLIEGRVADRIQKLRPLSVEISLYGFEKTHDLLTQCHGAFARTLSAIQLLKERRVRVFAKAPVLKENFAEIWKLKKFVLDDLGVKWRGIGGGLLLCPKDDGGAEPLEHRLTDKELEVYLQGLGEEYRFLGKTLGPRLPGSPDNPLCSAGFASCDISPYGELNPCNLMRLSGKNSLKDSSFREVWLNHPEMRQLRETRLRDRTDCMNCELSPYCSTCPGVAQSECGKATAKLPEACRQAKATKDLIDAAGACHQH